MWPRGCPRYCGASWTQSGESSTFPVWNSSTGFTVWLHQHPSVKTSSARRYCTRTRWIYLHTCWATICSHTFIFLPASSRCVCLTETNRPTRKCDDLRKKAKGLPCVCVPQAVRLEALHRFTVIWHLTREITTNRTMSLSRSFDRLVHGVQVVHCLDKRSVFSNVYHRVSV